MRSFPFDSDVTYDENGNPEYDRGADSTILSDFIHLMFTDGVFPNPSTGLQVTHSDETMSVIVLPGNCMIQGRMGIEEADRTLVFEASGTTYDRIDSVVARLNINHDYRDIDLYVVRGVEAGSPVPPELTRTGGVYELRLANVFIAKNTTVISSERITDTRLITDDCGIVTSNPKQVDTTSIFAQYQASLENYMRYVQECIDGTTAGNLQNQIDELDAKVDSVNSGLANLNTNLDEVSTNLENLSTSVGNMAKSFKFTCNGVTTSNGIYIKDTDGNPLKSGRYKIDLLSATALATECASSYIINIASGTMYKTVIHEGTNNASPRIEFNSAYGLYVILANYSTALNVVGVVTKL